MTTNEIFAPAGYTVKDNFLLGADNKVFAFINPASNFSYNRAGLTAYGPTGSIKVKKISKGAIKELRSIGFLFTCTDDDTAYLQSLFHNNSLSRSYSYLLNYCKSIREFKALVNKIAGTRILLIGCGGIGSNTAYLLAGMGCEKITLVDGDKVESSNLNRQTLYSKKDVGKFKVEVLSEKLTDRFSHMEIKATPEFLKTASLKKVIKGQDIIIVSADNPPNLYKAVVQYGAKMKKPVFLGGYQFLSGIVYLFNSAKKTRAETDKYVFPHYDIPPSSGIINYQVSAELTKLVIDQIRSPRKKNIFKVLS